jgi:hypothetical protein
LVYLGNLTVTETLSSGSIGASGTSFTSVSRFRDNIARVLLNYKFGGPILAKY